MRRILLVLSVVLVMAAMMVTSAGSVFAQVGPPCEDGNPSGDQPGGVETCEDTQTRLFDLPEGTVAFHNTATENPGGTNSITTLGGSLIAQSEEDFLLGGAVKHCPPGVDPVLDPELCPGNFFWPPDQ